VAKYDPTLPVFLWGAPPPKPSRKGSAGRGGDLGGPPQIPPGEPLGELRAPNLWEKTTVRSTVQSTVSGWVGSGDITAVISFRDTS